MKEFQTLQREMLRDLRQPQNWIAASVYHPRTTHLVIPSYVAELRIPKNADFHSYNNAAYTLMSELNLNTEIGIYSLYREGKVVALVFVAEDPKLVKELTTIDSRNIQAVGIDLGYFIYEREKDFEVRASEIKHFRNMMHNETPTTYYLTFDTATRDGLSPRYYRHALRNHDMCNEASADGNPGGDNFCR